MIRKIKNNVLLDEEHKVIIKRAERKGECKAVVKEFDNYLKVYNKSVLKIPKPLVLDKDNCFFKTEYVEGLNLRDANSTKLFYEFGNKLKKFHEEGFVHSELEVQDVIYRKNQFWVVDLPFLNEREPLNDYARFIISLNIQKLHKPWKFKFYNQAVDSFIRGYGLKNIEMSEKYVSEELDSIIKCYLRGKIIDKLKGLVLFITFIKLRLLHYKQSEKL